MNGSYTTKYLQNVDTILLPMQKAGSEFRRLAGNIGMVVGKWTELSQSQVWIFTESKSPFPMFYMVHGSNTLLLQVWFHVSVTPFCTENVQLLTQKLLDNFMATARRTR